MTESDRTPHYEIRLRGHLGPTWATFFDGMSLVNEPGGTAVLRGPVVDQAALHGLLNRLNDLGIELESLTHRPDRPEHDAHDVGPGGRPDPPTNTTGATT